MSEFFRILTEMGFVILAYNIAQEMLDNQKTQIKTLNEIKDLLESEVKKYE